jgi:hypothetical protein
VPGPIAQRLEQSAHKCAIVFTDPLPGQKNQAALRQKCLKHNLTWKGNPKGTVAWLEKSAEASLWEPKVRQLGCIWLRLNCLNPSRSGIPTTHPLHRIAGV